MTAVAPKPIVTRPVPVHQAPRGSAITRLLRTTDAKQIGLMYLVTSFAWFAIGGFMALLMRAELARPGLQFLSTATYENPTEGNDRGPHALARGASVHARHRLAVPRTRPASSSPADLAPARSSPRHDRNGWR